MWEKWPWWTVAAVFSGITYYTQSRTGAVISGARISLGERWSDVPVAYGFYMTKTFWPKGLAVVYPGLGFSWGGFVLALVVIGALTLACVRAGRRCAPLPVGWLWFVVTLLPVIGLVRAGVAQVADRFTYLPSIGLFVMLVWGLAELLTGWRRKQAVLAGLAVVALAGCGATTWFQLRHWQSSFTLFEHALAVTEHNALAHHNLGVALLQAGRVPDAVEHLQEMLRLKPADANARSNLAIALLRQGEVLASQGKWDEAIQQYQRAVELKPDNAQTHDALGRALSRAGRFAEAVAAARQALELAMAANNAALANDLRVQIGLYQAGTPFRDAKLTNASAAPRPTPPLLK